MYLLHIAINVRLNAGLDVDVHGVEDHGGTAVVGLKVVLSNVMSHQRVVVLNGGFVVAGIRVVLQVVRVLGVVVINEEDISVVGCVVVVVCGILDDGTVITLEDDEDDIVVIGIVVIVDGGLSVFGTVVACVVGIVVEVLVVIGVFVLAVVLTFTSHNENGGKGGGPGKTFKQALSIPIK